MDRSARNGTVSLSVALVILLFLAAPLAGQTLRLDYKDSSFKLLRYAALEAGTILQGSSSPYRLSELVSDMQRISAMPGLSTEAQEALTLASARLQAKPAAAVSGLGFKTSLDLSLEAYPGSHLANGLDRPWSWSERPALLRLPLELYAHDLFYAKTVLEIREDPNAIDRLLDPQDVGNWPESLDYIDYYFPFEAFTVFDSGSFWASAGRDSLRWGPGVTGTLVLSDAPQFYDYIELGLGNTAFSYRFALIELDPTLHAGETLDWPTLAADTSATTDKNLILHRLELFICNRMSIAITEGTMVGGIPLRLAMLNPLLILHNEWLWNLAPFTAASSILGLEVRGNPWRYVELYGTFAMNQVTTAYEKERYPEADVIPDAFAWQAGLDGAFPLDGAWLTLTAEYTYTSPWMYIRENQLVSYTWRRNMNISSNISDKRYPYVDSPVGYRYGPDAKVFQLSMGWDRPEKLNIVVGLEYVAKGQNNIDTAYAKLKLNTFKS